jgi:putative transposase
MIHPNNKQATKIRKTLNKCIECQNIIFDILDNCLKEKKQFPKCNDLRKEFTIIKKQKDEETINKRKNLTKQEQIKNHLDVLFYDVSNDALKQTIKDTYNAFVRYFKKISKYPKRKTYKDIHKSFYVDPYKIIFTDNKVKLEKIANNQKHNRQVLNYIKLAEKKRIPTNIKYYNPRVVYDGNRFYIVVAVDDINRPVKKNKSINEVNETSSIGIDLNINSIVTSVDKRYETVNKEIRVIKLNKRLKRTQRKLSKKYLIKEKEKRTSKNNIIKLKKELRKKYTKLKNIRDDYQYKVIYDIINNYNPKQIVVEDLDINQMKENKKITKSIQITNFRKFINKTKEITNKLNITLKQVDKYYPSSKLCSGCNNKKEDLKLSDRIYRCNKCGLIIDRDLNAAINLARC